MDTTHEIAGQAKGFIRGQVDRRTTLLGEQLNSTAGDLRRMTGQMTGPSAQTAGAFASSVADQIERLGYYLQDCDADRLMSDVERLARRQPWAFAGVGFVLGMSASRLLKASSSERFSRYARDLDYRR